MGVAIPLVDAKLSAIGAKLEQWDHVDVSMVNEWAANPQPELEIAVSNDRYAAVAN